MSTLPFDAAAMTMSDAERRIIGRHHMASDQRAAIAADQGEHAAADAEAAFNVATAEALLPEIRRGWAEGYAEAHRIAAADSARAERERIAAIVTAPEARGRHTAAFVLATRTPLAVEDARQVLASLPAAAA